MIDSCRKILLGLMLILLGHLSFLTAGNAGDSTRGDLKEKVFLVMETAKKEIFLHEKISLTVKLYVRGHSLRDIGYPKLSHPDFVIQDFETPVQKIVTLNGVEFETLEFRTTLFGIKTGRFKLGPVRIRSTLIVPTDQKEDSSRSRNRRDDYFGTPETRPISLESNELSIHVRSFPEKGQPEGFGGAVGNFWMDAEVQPREVKAGDPVTLKITINGDGNFDSLTPPDLGPVKGLKVHEAQVSQGEGVRIYEQVLIPESDQITEIPAIRLSFFNPKEVNYHTVSKGSFPIRVRKAEDPKVSVGEILPLQRSPGSVREKGDLLYRNRAFLLFHILPLFFLLSAWLHHKRRERIRTDFRYARQIEARKVARQGLREAERILRSGRTLEFYDSLFKTLQHYMGSRFGLPARSVTINVIEKISKAEGLNEEILEKIRGIFSECDRARYGTSEFNKSEREETLQMFKKVVSHLGR